MNEKTASALRDLPEKPPRSKLDLQIEVIRALSRKQYGYRDIAESLQEHLGLVVSPITIHDFVRTRVSGRMEAAEAARPSNVSKGNQQQTLPRFPHGSKRSKNEPPVCKPPARRFVYDENEPLRLAKKYQPANS